MSSNQQAGLTDINRPTSCVISIGSNQGDRLLNLRRAIARLQGVLSIVRLSSVFQSEPVGCPPGSPDFLNMVVLGSSALATGRLVSALLSIESRLGRMRRQINAPRTVDLDLILYGALMVRSPLVEVPHPRFVDREFVLAPMRELNLAWRDPRSGKPVAGMKGSGQVRRIGSVYLPKPWLSRLTRVPFTDTEACLSSG